MMHTTEVEEALMLKTMAEEVEALIEKGNNMLMMMDTIHQGVGSNVKADDQSQKSPEGVPPTYEDVVAPLFTLPIIAKLPDDNKALDGLTKLKEAALLDAERTV
uniref:Uncharacterized protein n=1 Tax=Lactuca sativa TaxID=4236 RepID=A0A9R1WTC0_LACSA|nr:hypothetical protein LSAT_V11C900484370 [Lactuca sativa]